MPLVFRRARTSRTLLVAAAITALLTTTLLTAFLQYAQLLPDAGTRAAVAAVPLPERSVKVVGGSSAQDHAAEAAEKADHVVRRFRDGIAGMPVTVSDGGYAIGQRLPDQFGGTPPRLDGTYAVIAFLGGLPDHATLTAGAWPRRVPADEPAQVALPSGVAETLRVRVGDRLPIVDRRTSTDQPVVVSGLWTPRDPGEPYWQLAADPVTAGGYGPMVVDRDEFMDRYLGLSTLEWVAAPAPSAVVTADLGAVAQAVDDLRRTGIPGPDNSWYPAIQTRLDELAGRLATARIVNRSGLILPALLVLVIAAYSLFLVARLITEQRRGELALLRARGASRGQVARLAAAEALLVAAPAAVLGAPLAAVLLRLSDRWLRTHGMTLAAGGALGSPTAWLISVVAALGCSVALVLPAARRSRTWVAEQQERSRPGRWSVVQRAGVDIALVVVALLSWSQLRQYAGPLTRGGSGLDIDPLLVVAPAVGVLAAAMVSLRALPGATRLGVGVAQRRRSFARLLGMWHADRRPHAGPVLLLVLAVSVAGLASCVAASWQRSQRDQASHTVGADLRLDAVGGGVAPLPTGTFALPGVRDAVAASHRAQNAGDVSAELLALDTTNAAGVVRLRDDLTAPGALDSLAAKRLTVPSTALPAGARRLRGEVRFSTADRTNGDLFSGPLSVVFDDGTGTLSEVSLGSFAADGRLAFDVAVPYPFHSGLSSRLVGLRLSAGNLRNDNFDEARVSGTVRWQFSDLTTRDAAGTPTPVPPLPEWTFRTRSANAAGPPGTDPPRVTTVSGTGTFTLTAGIPPMFPGSSWDLFASGLPDRQPGFLPGLVTPQLLAATGTAVGGVIRLGTSLSAGLQIDVVGTIDAVPSVTSANAVVVDLPSLDAYRLLQGDPLDPGNGWWLSVDPAAHDQVRAALAGLAGFTISDRAQLTDRLLADPLGWGVLFALYVAVLGATVLAAFGLAVDARATSLRSAGELAVLHTLGTPPRTLARALVVEQSVLAGLGVVAGLIAGVAVAAAMAPSLILTERGARPVPPVLLVMPPVQLVVPAVVLFGVALGLGAATARRARRDVAVGLLRIGADQ